MVYAWEIDSDSVFVTATAEIKEVSQPRQPTQNKEVPRYLSRGTSNGSAVVRDTLGVSSLNGGDRREVHKSAALARSRKTSGLSNDAASESSAHEA